ncbi:MAG: hypothetical protein ACKO72_07700, partial [Actinomycetes bacterium]
MPKDVPPAADQPADAPTHGATDRSAGIDAEAVEARVDALRALIRHHDDRYYGHDDPEISDAEYDAL